MSSNDIVPSKGRVYGKFIVILILAGLAAFVVFGQKWDFKLGLDLQGGAHLLYEGDMSGIEPRDREDAMESVRDVIERRVNAFGVAEPVVAVSGEDRLIVELPGVTDIGEAIRQIGLTPFLEFRVPNPDFTPDETLSPQEQANQAYLPSGLSGKHLKRSDIVFDPQTRQPQISLEFNKEGEELFAEITRTHVGQQVAIFLDGELISAPVVNQEITSGQAVITGNFTPDEAKGLAQRLNAGALPVPIMLIQQQNIGAALGQDSIDKSLLAGTIGLLAVALFMVTYYRAPGLLAVVALGIYTILNLAVYQLIPITLTLAGIAGFILSVGMAVDANILIFERTREELRAGFFLDKSVDEGFRRAWLAIRDSNFSTLITVFILGVFSASLIRGFAFTLGIGIVLSMFTAIIVTRTFLELFIIHDVKIPFGVKTKRND